jgi:hypothetical protein
MSSEEIRGLLKSAQSTPKTGSRMAVQRMHKYTRGGHTVTSARVLTNAQLADAIVKAKAKASPQVACFDSAGNLIGTVSQDAITLLSPAVDPAPPKKSPGDAQAAQVTAAATTPPSSPVQPDAIDGPAADPVAQAAAEVKKALAGARFTGGGRDALVKAAGGSVDARYAALVRVLDKGHRGMLSDTVARSAMRFTYGRGMTGPDAVRLAKSIALDFAAAEARKPQPGIEAALAAVRQAHARPRRVS